MRLSKLSHSFSVTSSVEVSISAIASFRYGCNTLLNVSRFSVIHCPISSGMELGSSIARSALSCTQLLPFPPLYHRILPSSLSSISSRCRERASKIYCLLAPVNTKLAVARPPGENPDE